MTNRRPIKVKFDKKSEDYYIDIKDFSDVIDIGSIHFYDLEISPNNEIRVSFFDKDKNLIPVKKG